jgi:hypothetical protein
MDGRLRGASFGLPADAGLSPEELAAMAGLARRAREQGVAVTGSGGLLKAVVSRCIEMQLGSLVGFAPLLERLSSGHERVAGGHERLWPRCVRLDPVRRSS